MTTTEQENDSTKSFSTPRGGLPVTSAQERQIWKWGVDESLWNPDRSRYAGRLSPLPGCEGYQGNPDEGNLDLMERVKRADEWFEKCCDMTEDEKKQAKRAMDAFLEIQGKLFNILILLVALSSGGVIRTIG